MDHFVHWASMRCMTLQLMRQFVAERYAEINRLRAARGLQPIKPLRYLSQRNFVAAQKRAESA